MGRISMRRTSGIAAAILIIGLLGAPARAHEVKMTTLGTDPVDAAPGVDLVKLEAGRAGSDLLLLFHLSSMLPQQGSYPGAGIEWTFDVGAKTFVAEGHPEVGGEFVFTLYQVTPSSFFEVAKLDGSVDWDIAHMEMHIPLRLIGAKKGTRISGTGPKGTEDVDIHQHTQAGSFEMDVMATNRDYIVR